MPETLVVTEGALMEAVNLAVCAAFRWTEAETLARFEAPLIAAEALRLLLMASDQAERAASLQTIGGLYHVLGVSNA